MGAFHVLTGPGGTHAEQRLGMIRTRTDDPTRPETVVSGSGGMRLVAGADGRTHVEFEAGNMRVDVTDPRRGPRFGI